MRPAIAAFLLACCCHALAADFVVGMAARDVVADRIWPVNREAFRRIGITAVPRHMPTERSLAAANAGTVDADGGRIAGLEAMYPDLVRVPEPIYTFEVRAFTIAPSFDAKGWDSLRGHSVCFRRGYKLFEMRTREVKRWILDSDKAIMALVQKGHCDIALSEQGHPDVVQAMQDDTRLRMVDPPLEVAPLYLYLHKRHAALAPQLAEALRAMRADGTMARLLK